MYNYGLDHRELCGQFLVLTGLMSKDKPSSLMKKNLKVFEDFNNLCKEEEVKRESTKQEKISI